MCHVVVLSEKTAQEFLPAELHKHGAVDLAQLADLARDAINGSEASLKAAGNIADSNMLARLWNSGKLAHHVIDSIGHIRDISKVNLGLSAICNDLAADSLRYAKKIDENHATTHKALNDVKRQTGELLLHLRATRESSALEPLARAFAEVDASSPEAVQRWLHVFSESMDLQYRALQDNIKQLAQKQELWTDGAARIQAELGRLGSLLQTQGDIAAHQLDLLRAQIGRVSEHNQSLDANMRQSHEKLASGITQLNARLEKHKSHFHSVLDAESVDRQQQHALMLETLEEKERAISGTIRRLNAHLLKRLFWAVGGLLALQLAGFLFLSVKMGLWQ